MSETASASLFDTLHGAVEDVIVGNDDVIEGLAVALLTGGHVLLEGVPGVAKTTMANVFAAAIGLERNRIQLTPDLLPADITGTHVYREHTGEFAVERGPVFANLVIADEINRATPKTQSALLEAMQERNVTIRGETLPVPTPFMVVATQNPIEMEGTFPLPQAQRDRFLFKLVVDLPNRANERELLDRFDVEDDLSAADVEQALSADDILRARETARDVHVADPVREYILDVVRATRSAAGVEHGASPRATLAFLRGGKARAAVRGRDYVIPDDVKALAHPVLRHRLLLGAEADLREDSPAAVVDAILEDVEPPSARAGED